FGHRRQHFGGQFLGDVQFYGFHDSLLDEIGGRDDSNTCPSQAGRNATALIYYSRRSRGNSRELGVNC
ncbi:MAG: hypothetical protein ACRD4A_05530, partial [Candidatus Acidiferrales bacterium]